MKHEPAHFSKSSLVLGIIKFCIFLQRKKMTFYSCLDVQLILNECEIHMSPLPPTPSCQFKPLTIFYWVEFDVLLSKFFVPSSFQSHFFSNFFPFRIYVGIGVRKECCSILLYLHKHLMLSNQTIE